MIQRIQSILRQCGIAEYLLCEKSARAEELYLIGHREDMRRNKRIRQCLAAVYYTTPDSRSEAKTVIFPEMSDDEVAAALRSAMETARSLNNEFYAFPSPSVCAEPPEAASDSSACRLADAAIQADQENKLLHLEVFQEQVTEHLVSSWGTDMWKRSSVWQGEFSVGHTGLRDIEVFREFSFDRPDEAALAQMLREAVSQAKLRADTTAETQTGVCDVIFTDHFVHELLKMYLVRSNAEQVCTKRSGYEIGKQVMGTASHPDIWLEPSASCSAEGIPMARRLLLKNGVLQTVHGDARFCRKLGLEPCGAYTGLYCESGERSLAQMQAAPYFMPLLFSDFIMYGSSGDFFGEIRLGYCFDGETLTPVYGGSISGNLAQLEHTMVFSKERYREKDYDGPKALRLSGVRITGQER